MEKIRLFNSKNKFYEIEKEDVWKIFTFFVISIFPLIFSTLKFANMRISLIISIIFFVLIIVISWVVFVKKRKII